MLQASSDQVTPPGSPALLGAQPTASGRLVPKRTFLPASDRAGGDLGSFSRKQGVRRALRTPHAARPRSAGKGSCCEFLPQGHSWPKTKGRRVVISSQLAPPLARGPCRLAPAGPSGVPRSAAAPRPSWGATPGCHISFKNLHSALPWCRDDHAIRH